MRVDFLFLSLFFLVEVGRLGAVTSGRREASVAVSSRRDFSSKWTAVWCVLRRYSVTMRRVFRERVWCPSMVRCATVCPKKPESGR